MFGPAPRRLPEGEQQGKRAPEQECLAQTPLPGPAFAPPRQLDEGQRIAALEIDAPGGIVTQYRLQGRASQERTQHARRGDGDASGAIVVIGVPGARTTGPSHKRTENRNSSRSARCAKISRSASKRF
jgi:hypothetical protein